MLARCRPLPRRWFSTKSNAENELLLNIPHADVFRFGDAPPATPLFAALDWRVRDDEAWAVIGHGSARKTQLLETLRGQYRIHPAPPPPLGLWPALTAAGADPYAAVALLGFAHRAGPDFVDYTARYGALRDGDGTTLRAALGDGPGIGVLAERLGFTPQLLDTPEIALSNGQTRRARILRALLARPHVLLLDEPLTGLDPPIRALVSRVLYNAHVARAPRVVLGLRAQDPVPAWITHVLDVDPPGHLSAPTRGVWLGPREAWQAACARAAPPPTPPAPPPSASTAAPIAELRDVRVAYGARSVLSGVDWTIRPGERWHLRGGNGAGKSTLLALLCGAHPLSHAQRGGLRLFGKPRGAWDAPALRARVGRVGPELADALPRARGRSVWEVVGTGFEGAFVPLGNGGVGNVEGVEREARVERMWEVLAALGPAAWGADREPPSQRTRGTPAPTPPGTPADARTLAFATTDYADLAPGERSLTLLARALVGRPPLLLLDEAWAGMDGAQVAAARSFLRSTRGVGERQAVVVVSHWEEEVPWGPGEVKRITMDGGRAVVEE